MSNLFKGTKFSYFFGPPSCFFQKYAYLCNPLHRKDEAGEIEFDFGEMAEWSNAAVLKTVDLNGSGGSNPSLSANKLKLSALRWAFFVHGCRAPRCCKDLRYLTK